MSLFIIFLPFVYLWYRVFDSVHLEWSTNPQYSYGWVVPFLCIGLIIRNWSTLSTSPAAINHHPSTCPTNSKFQLFTFPSSQPNYISAFCFLLFACGILLFLPARLVAFATPEWRPLQWILAFIAVGSTLFLIRSVWGRAGIVAFGFPVLFFLVAVPWPSPIEQPIIQSLTSTDASFVVELMGVLGVPAIQHGNVIQVSSGIVGIDEACSGIRSFQSSLMISLFLGEFYRLRWTRRLILFVLGIVLSFAFNVCRTSFLTWIAAKKGVSAIAHYHDEAGLLILVACTITLWLVGLYLTRKPSPAPGISNLKSQISNPSAPPACGISAFQPFSFSAFRCLLPLSVALIVWFATIEIGAQLWFSYRESKLVIGPAWTLAFPTEDPTFRPITLTEKTYGLLRFDEGREGDWTDSTGIRFHAFYFNWVPGRVAGYLAKRHTPEICMGAAGENLKAGPDLYVTTIHGITLPIRQYLYESQGSRMHVFHCRWEVGADQNATVQHESARLNLIRGVWAGRGKYGQKVIEVIVTGDVTPKQARAALIRQLETLVKVEDKAGGKQKFGDQKAEVQTAAQSTSS